jgi:Putative MetA-pathway of phenol degradation
MRTPVKWLGSFGLASILATSEASAGPPYTTDDPEPVEYRHWEVYLASQSFHDKDGWTGTAPHVEVNYGVVPNVQLHVIAPFAYSVPASGSKAYGYGDTELGVKFRFIQERTSIPMIGTFPLLEVPTGSEGAGLGNGAAQAFLPVWLQKTFGPWLTYGGVGVWLDLGDRSRHWWYFGLQVQRTIVKWFSVGAEVFYQTPMVHGEGDDSRFNVGAVLDITEMHHLLVSAGRGFEGPNLFQGYAAYQLTFGRKE